MTRGEPWHHRQWVLGSKHAEAASEDVDDEHRPALDTALLCVTKLVDFCATDPIKTTALSPCADGRLALAPRITVATFVVVLMAVTVIAS